MEVEKKSPVDFEKTIKRDIALTDDMFIKTQGKDQTTFPEGERIRVTTKILQEYDAVKEYVPLAKKVKKSEENQTLFDEMGIEEEHVTPTQVLSELSEPTPEVNSKPSKNIIDAALSELNRKENEKNSDKSFGLIPYQALVNNNENGENEMSNALIVRQQSSVPKPAWHAPWKLDKVITGHLGWVNCVDVDVSNEWFATGSNDRTIKIWDLASGTLKLTLTGHSHSVRAVAISERSPFMFTGGEDKAVKCWDLETNRVIRSYTGHLSGVYSLALHPTLDILFSGGRDSVCRVWDIRTKAEVMVLGGHKGTICSIVSQAAEPQLITGSMDATMRLWDLAAGSTSTVLTHHKKGVRSIVFHPEEYTFASASADNIKKWKCPEGTFLHNITGHNYILNTISINRGNVLFSGGNNGKMRWYDWETGYCFDQQDSKLIPGTLESEASILASCYDKTGTRLITCEGDKSIKIWKEDEEATEELNPIDMERWKLEWRNRRKNY
ncbi:hypothetical protein WA158_008514 [Blastocystis sp. Blastoise]